MLQSSCMSAETTYTAVYNPSSYIQLRVQGRGCYEGMMTYTAEPGPSRARVAPVPLKMDFIPPSA
jgi:hypothetical protein